MIIVHGLYGASDNWVQIGKALASQFEVFLIDQRNHGRSPHDPEFNYDVLKQDLLDFMDRENIHKAILLGHSMGGKTVMFFAADHPDRTHGLIVVDIAPKSYRMQKGHTLHHEMIAAMQKVDFLHIKTRKEVDAILEKDIPSTRVRQFLLKNLHRNADQTFQWSLNLDALAGNLENILGGMDETRFSKGNEVTGFPVLFIRGGDSAYIEDTDIPLIHRIFPYADIETIPGAGHWLHAEQPELLIREILDYFLY